MRIATKEQLKEVLKNKKAKIFFLRICGTGQGAASMIMRQMGYEIAGADSEFYPPMSDFLESEKIQLLNMSELTMDDLKKYDLIVVGNAIAKNSDWGKSLTNDNSLLLTTFPDLLGASILNEKIVVGVAGTHGKTTTTYLLTQIANQLDLKASHLIGGVIGKPMGYVNSGKYFFIESDEYDTAYFKKDSKFFYYNIHHLILTSVEFDHGDIFPDLETMENAFKKLIDIIPGNIIYNNDYPISSYIAKQNREIENYSYGNNSIKIVTAAPEGTSFSFLYKNITYKTKTNLVGTHNILNLTAALQFFLSQGFNWEDLNKTLGDLKLPQRRQELKYSINGNVFIDDFAHHPTAVAQTLKAIALKYPDKELCLVFAPHSATARSSVFQKDWSNSMELASKICLVKPNKANSVVNAQLLNMEVLAKELKEKYLKEVVIVQELNELKNLVDDWVSEKNTINMKKVVAVFSNGPVLGFWKMSL